MGSIHEKKTRGKKSCATAPLRGQCHEIINSSINLLSRGLSGGEGERMRKRGYRHERLLYLDRKLLSLYPLGSLLTMCGIHAQLQTTVHSSPEKEKSKYLS
jgi:hypothetical protein